MTEQQDTEVQKVEVPPGTIYAPVDLVGIDGNAAFSIMGVVGRALREVGNPKEIIDSYREQSMAGDYDHLLRVAIAFTGGYEESQP